MLSYPIPSHPLLTVRSSITHHKIRSTTVEVLNHLHKHAPCSQGTLKNRHPCFLSSSVCGMACEGGKVVMEAGWCIHTSWAVLLLVMSPWICTTPSMGAIGCRSMATIKGEGVDPVLRPRNCRCSGMRMGLGWGWDQQTKHLLGPTSGGE